MTAAETFLTEFDPSGRRGRAVNARMRARLRDSLEYIISQAENYVAIPRSDFDAFFARLERGPISPLIFGAYCELVLAFEEDNLIEAARLLREIAAAPNAEDGPRIVYLPDPNKDAGAKRYCRLVDTDPDFAITLSPPGDAAAPLGQLLAHALALIDAGNPALGDEIRAIVREIVLAYGSQDAKGLKFDGVSSFMLWGGIVLNVTGYQTVIELVQALAHESGHNLLFGLCADGPLQENDDRERYPSPLRLDQRPMDGIVHATYVTARMHQSIQRLLDAGIVDAAQQEEARRANLANTKYFASGLQTIEQYARLTPLGRAVIDSARAYMSPYLCAL
jgi:HEXXH motif-containing protein